MQLPLALLALLSGPRGEPLSPPDVPSPGRGATVVAAHGEFLDALLAPSDGFLLLDLHNLWCQAVNFDVPADVLASAMPLERVREVHLSGGRWATLHTLEGPQRFRRDTHDGGIPDEVLELLALILPRCPRLEVVFVERLGGTLPTEPDGERYREDYRRVLDIVNGIGAAGVPQELELAELQAGLLDALRSAASPDDALSRLARAPLSDAARRWLARIDPRALETAIELARRWTQLDASAELKA